MVQNTELAPAGALCAAHPGVPAHAVCSRCGNYACLPCTHSSAQRSLCTACFQAAKGPGHLGEASKLQRFLNMVVDYWVAGIVANVLVGITLVLLGAGALLGKWWILYPMLVGAQIGYYVAFEGLLGRTPGKLLTGTAVVSADGSRPTLKQIVRRSLIRLIPFEPFSFLGEDYGWHDAWTGTRVIRVRGKPRWDATS